MSDLTALFVLSLGVVAWLASFVLIALNPHPLRRATL